MNQLQMDGSGYALFVTLSAGAGLGTRTERVGSCVYLCGYSLDVKTLWLQCRGCSYAITFSDKRVSADNFHALESVLTNGMHRITLYGVVSFEQVIDES